jgi:hypothetical protein
MDDKTIYFVGVVALGLSVVAISNLDYVVTVGGLFDPVGSF